MEAPVPEKHVITFTDGDAACIGMPKLAAPLLLDRLFGQLGLDKLCATLKHSLGLTYDLTGFLRLLLFGRILQPASKWETVQQNAHYMAPLADTTYPYHIYDTLDILAEHKEQFIRRMHSSICKSIGRSTAHIYYDVTNFFSRSRNLIRKKPSTANSAKGCARKVFPKKTAKNRLSRWGFFWMIMESLSP